jgi:hypothetical protein
MLDEMREEHRLQREVLQRWAEQGERRDEERDEELRLRDEELRLRDEEFRLRDEALRLRDEELRQLAERHRAELKALREDQKRRFDAMDAAMENDRRVTRDIILELREGQAMLRDMRHGIQANTEGLLRVLDELRRNDGPSTASA